MRIFEAQDTHQALEEILQKERDAIMNGQFDRLEKLSVEKESLIKALSKARIDRKTLVHLREQSERNGILLDAMRSGIESALERVRALKDARPALQTYDQSGRKMEMKSNRTSTARRA